MQYEIIPSMAHICPIMPFLLIQCISFFPSMAQIIIPPSTKRNVFVFSFFFLSHREHIYNPFSHQYYKISSKNVLLKHVPPFFPYVCDIRLWTCFAHCRAQLPVLFRSFVLDSNHQPLHVCSAYPFLDHGTVCNISILSWFLNLVSPASRPRHIYDEPQPFFIF